MRLSKSQIRKLLWDEYISIEYGKDSGKKRRQKINTRIYGGFREIRISDTGNGITEDIRIKIFDPFFA